MLHACSVAFKTSLTIQQCVWVCGSRGVGVVVVVDRSA